MKTTKSISGFLDIDSEKYLFKEKNEPMPDCLGILRFMRL
jgi:hypothetical protein